MTASNELNSVSSDFSIAFHHSPLNLLLSSIFWPVFFQFRFQLFYISIRTVLKTNHHMLVLLLDIMQSLGWELASKHILARSDWFCYGYMSHPTLLRLKAYARIGQKWKCASFYSVFPSLRIIEICHARNCKNAISTVLVSISNFVHLGEVGWTN